MNDAINLAQGQSIDAMVAKNTFLSNYWSFRSFQASKLPSLNFNANIANFDRSQRALQNYETGEITYRDNYNMYNTGSFSINQNIFATGGQLSLYSSLSRLDQWAPSREITYYTQPVTLSYLQPLWSYNSFKWDKKIEPEKYEQSKKEYLELMEGITIKAVTNFYDLLLHKINHDIALSNYNNTRTMYNIASQRFVLGSVKKAELLQLELRLINDSLAISTQDNAYQSKKMEIKSFLGLNENAEIDLLMPESIPEITIDYELALEKALRNSSFIVSQRISELEAERNVAIAKGNRGITAQVSTQFGLSNNSNSFKKAYSNLLDQEIIGLTFSVPILDWGMGRGRVKVAEAQLETAKNKIEQALIDYRQDIIVQILQFNSQRNQCQLARRARDVAEERYGLTMANFANGTVSVTDLNTAQSEKDEAQKKYIAELSNFWIYYFTLRKVSLYDYITGTDISTEFDRLTE